MGGGIRTVSAQRTGGDHRAARRPIVQSKLGLFQGDNGIIWLAYRCLPVRE